MPYTDDTANFTTGTKLALHNWVRPELIWRRGLSTPWRGYAEAANPVTGMYYVNCNDFRRGGSISRWAMTDPNHLKFN